MDIYKGVSIARHKGGVVNMARDKGVLTMNIAVNACFIPPTSLP